MNSREGAAGINPEDPQYTAQLQTENIQRGAMDIFQVIAIIGIVFSVACLIAILIRQSFKEHNMLAIASILTSFGLYFTAFYNERNIVATALIVLTVGIVAYIYGWYRVYADHNT